VSLNVIDDLTTITSVVGVGGGGGISNLAPDDGTGPVSSDDFDREDSDTIGNGWVESGSVYELVSGRLVVSLAGSLAAACGKQDATRTIAAGMFLQGLIRLSDEYAGFWVMNDPTYASLAGYRVRLMAPESLVRIDRFVAGSPTTVASEAKTLEAATDYPVQLYVAPGVQQANVGGTDLSASDTTHDEAEDMFFAFRALTTVGDSGDFEFDDALLTPSPFVTVSGLDTGQKAKVLNASEEVVATATESGGTATIDCSIFGGATEVVPLAGWEALIVTDADDVELARYDAAGIFPGYAYTAS
jgi:hypothetical protein